MVNVDLIKRVIEFIDRDPGKLKMDSWFESFEWHVDDEMANQYAEGCGTTACVAGWATILHHNLTPEIKEWGSQWKELVYRAPGSGDWSEEGAAALGFDDRLASAIFYQGHEKSAMDMLRDLASGMTDLEVLSRWQEGEYGRNAMLVEDNEEDSYEGE